MSEREWGSGLFSCFQECGTCSYSCCCLPCATASARTNFDGSNWCFNCMCVTAGTTQSIIRDGYRIEGDCISDVCASCCLSPCATTRMLREVKNRGPCGSKTTITATGQLVRLTDSEKSRPWSTGLCECHQNCGICIRSFCCPCCSTASARTDYDGSSWLFNLVCATPCAVRNIIREGKFNIEGDCLTDCCIGCFCVPCSAAQMLRELESRKATAAPLTDLRNQAPGQHLGKKKKSSRRSSEGA